MKQGDQVEKVGGDYTFVGEIVASFHKKSGAVRFVVEDDRGVLHIYSGKNLRIASPRPCDCEIYQVCRTCNPERFAEILEEGKQP